MLTVLIFPANLRLWCLLTSRRGEVLFIQERLMVTFPLVNTIYIHNRHRGLLSDWLRAPSSFSRQ
jgi:hypothetical protein